MQNNNKEIDNIMIDNETIELSSFQKSIVPAAFDYIRRRIALASPAFGRPMKKIWDTKEIVILILIKH